MTPASKGIRVAWVIVGVALAYLRLHGTMDNRFQATAHLVVGSWFGAWALGCAAQGAIKRWATMRPVPISPVLRLYPAFYFYLGFVVSMVEAYAFLKGIGKLDGR